MRLRAGRLCPDIRLNEHSVVILPMTIIRRLYFHLEESVDAALPDNSSW